MHRAPARLVLAAVLCVLPTLLLAEQEPRLPASPEARGPVIASDEMTRCLALIKNKQYDAARRRLEPIVLAHPGWARAHFLLALTYHEEQRYSMARPLFARALELDPQERAILPFYGWCLYYLGEAEASRKQFAAYLETNADHADAHYAIGLIDYDQDDLDSALARFRTTIRLAARDPRTEGKARARLADVHVRRGELAQARTELERAVELRPDAYEAFFKLSRVLERLGDHEGAERARRTHDEIRERVRPTAKPPAREEQPPAAAGPSFR
jgi:Tfp pilus assembly protein PilF